MSSEKYRWKGKLDFGQIDYLAEQTALLTPTLILSGTERLRVGNPLQVHVFSNGKFQDLFSGPEPVRNIVLVG